MGVSRVQLPYKTCITDCETSITKLMGESFKLHSQALIGYEDSMSAEHNQGATTPQLAPHNTEVAAY